LIEKRTAQHAGCIIFLFYQSEHGEGIAFSANENRVLLCHKKRGVIEADGGFESASFLLRKPTDTR
jgi:hypothetical protein